MNRLRRRQVSRGKIQLYLLLMNKSHIEPKGKWKEAAEFSSSPELLSIFNI